MTDYPTVLDTLPVELIKRFQPEGWLLTRNDNDEIGVIFGEAFGTEDRGTVESYWRANAIVFEWQPDGGLQTTQYRSTGVCHPATDNRCWFNQVSFLNEWTIVPEAREYLVGICGADRLPFNTRFGNSKRSGRTSCSCSIKSTRPTPDASRGSRRPDARRQYPHRPQQ